MSSRSFHLLIPGSLQQNTGGYIYDRRIVEGLQSRGWEACVHELDPSFPLPADAALAQAAETLQSLPDDALVVIDGLALGPLHEHVSAHAPRLCLIGLIHHPLALESGLQPTVAERLRHDETRALSQVHAVITTSDSTAESLADYGVDNAIITSVPPGTDRPAGQTLQNPESISFVTSERGHPPNANSGHTVTLLCVGSLVPRKGHDVLIDALALLPMTHWHLLCVGSDQRDTDWAAALRQRVAAAGLSDRISLTGEVDQSTLSSCYRHADLFVLASRHEGYGMVFDEAIAHGLPIVSTTAGAIPQTVPTGVGLLVEPDDAKALSAALGSLLQDERTRLSLQRGAIEACQHLRSWEQACREFGEVLDATASGRR